MQEPGGEERADQHAVLHQGVAEPKGLPVFEQPFQCIDDIGRVHLHKTVVNITLHAVLGAYRIVLHPILQRLHAVGVAPPGYARDAILVHAPLDMRDHGLHHRMVDILVRPEQRFVDLSPFPLAAVRVPVPLPPLQRFVHVLVPSHQVLDELAEFHHIFIHMRLNFQDFLIQAVVAVSPVTAIDFLDSQAQVFIGDDLLVNSNSFHQG